MIYSQKELKKVEESSLKVLNRIGFCKKEVNSAFSDTDVKKILKKFHEEYDFLYENYDRVSGYNEALESWDDYIKKQSFKDLVGKLNKARMDIFSSDREIVALMFALDDLGYLDKIDVESSSHYISESGRTLKEYKIYCPQFNREVEINKMSRDGDALAQDFMKNRRKSYFSKREAKEALKKYKGTPFALWLQVGEVDPFTNHIYPC